MQPDTISTIVATASASFLIPALWKRVVGTRYRTEKDCASCETRRAVNDIRRMVRELAIKAGVPVHEALRVGDALDDKKTGGEG